MNKRNKIIYGVILFTAVIVGRIDLSNALENYNGYGGYVIGDQRIVGLAGAYLAKSNDLNAVNYNPAGLIFSPAAMDIGIGTSQINNSPTDFDQNGTKDSFPLNYWFSGVIGRTHRQNPNINIAVGLVYNTPYAAHQNFDGKVLPTTTIEKYDLQLAVNSFTIPVALQLNQKIAIGVNCNVYNVEESIKMKYPLYYMGMIIDWVDIDDEQEVSATLLDWGIILKPTNKLSLGGIFKPKKTFSLEEKKIYTKTYKADTQINWYRGVTLPLRAGLGANYQFTPSCGLALDTNYIAKQDNTVLVGSNLVSGVETYEFKDKGVWDVHLGGNYLWTISNTFKIDWRAGTYFEPSRVKKLDNRWHYTGGLQLNLWKLVFGLGYDTAKDYKNLVTVVAVVLKH